MNNDFITSSQLPYAIPLRYSNVASGRAVPACTPQIIMPLTYAHQTTSSIHSIGAVDDEVVSFHNVNIDVSHRVNSEIFGPLGNVK